MSETNLPAFESERCLKWDSSDAWSDARKQELDRHVDDYLGDQNVFELGLDEHHELLVLLKAAQARCDVSDWAAFLEKEHTDWYRRLMQLVEKDGGMDAQIQFAFDGFLDCLDEVLNELGITDWLVQGRNMGWRKRTGYKTFKASSAQELLRAVLPDTDCSYTIYIHPTYLTMLVAHHDAPTGESYWLQAQPDDNTGIPYDESRSAVCGDNY